jgi:signal transduction histidine kinase/ligand-binding sensor domain-containing protein/DNA-binding response OmpR family regulator
MKNNFLLPVLVPVSCFLVLVRYLLFSGADVYAAENSILFNRLDVNSGLSSNEVSCVYKDRKGFMWFGTGAGLTRYDGYEFKTYRHEIDGTLFSEAYIMQLVETMDGKLWVTYQTGEISIFDLYTNTFNTVAEIQQLLDIPWRIVNVFQDEDFQLLFATDHKQLYKYDYVTRQSKNYPVTRDEGGVCDLICKGKEMYVIYYSGAVEIINMDNFERILKDDFLKSVPAPRRFNLYVDSKNELWIYFNPENSDGLFHFNPHSKVWNHYTALSSQPLSSSLIRGVEEDVEGNIWIATDHGGINLIRKDGTVQYIRNDPFDRQSISQNSVICLYKDNTGIIWCGTYKNGVNYYHESIFKFKSIRYPIIDAADASINDCNCVYEDESGNLWIGTNGNGLLHYNRTARKYRRYVHDPFNPKSISSNIIVCMENDSDGNLWIGSYMGGLDCFDGKSFTHCLPAENSQYNYSVYSLFLDDNHQLWVGTLGLGLYGFDLNTKQWIHFNASNKLYPLLSDNVYTIVPLNLKELLIGTDLGINVLDVESRQISLFGGTKDRTCVFKDKAINTIYLDSRKLLWIGSNNGLSIYDSLQDSSYHLDKTNLLPDNDILSVMEDQTGIMWLGTKNCLLKIIPVYNDAEKKYQFEHTAYYENEGISGRIFNRNGACMTSNGEFIFGGTNGLTVFDPVTIKYNTNPPNVVFTGLYLPNRQVLPGKEYDGNVILPYDISYTHAISLSYEQRSFLINISALNYFLPGKTHFSFFMEGFDKTWTTVDAGNRNITYTNLPPGNYTFWVKAKNNDGVWSAVPAELAIHIAHPFWAAPWAFIFYILTGILLIYILVKVIVRSQRRKFKKEQEHIASRQLHEMDEMKLRFFTNVSHEFRTPLTLIIAPVEKLIKKETREENKKILELVHENATQLLSLVNQLLDFRKIDVQRVKLLLSSGDIVLFIRNIMYSFKDLSEQQNIRFTFSTTIPSLMMKFDTDKIFKIVSNLLSNAFKFTPEGGSISVNLQLQNREDKSNELLIQIADTGIGIDPDKYELIFTRFYQIPSGDNTNTTVGTGIGLHICREFVKLHNGTISVAGGPGKGSIFTIALPVALSEIEEVISTPDKNDPNVPQKEIEITNDKLEYTILIVDDNRKFRDFMKLSLNDNYNILNASDGEDAWPVILDKLPDMVISDVMMPVMDGIELCKRIKQDIRTSHIPVILLTARSAQESKLIGLEAGADDYIGKPFNMDMLILKIRHILKLRNRMQKQFMQSAKKGIQLTEMNISSLDEELMQKAIRYIEKEIANPELSVERLSREMGMSRVNFYKKTMSITGKTPVELIRAIRMKHAATLLRKSQLRINEAAFKVGINDTKLFRKYFKEEYGVLPSDYMESKPLAPPKEEF